MRYRFNGLQDAPEWILAEVSTLSRIVRRWRVVGGTFVASAGVAHAHSAAQLCLPSWLSMTQAVCRAFVAEARTTSAS